MEKETKQEIWKPAVGYEEYLEVSNLGNARRKEHSFKKSNGRWCHVPSCILKKHPTKTGYLLINAKGTKSEQIHRLVAKTFIPNPLNLPEVNHKDEDKTNNCVNNLEWCDHKYNSSYGSRNKKISIKLSEVSKKKQVFQYTKNGKFIQCFPSIADATRQTGVKSICLCLNHKQKYGGNFVWLNYNETFDEWENKISSIKTTRRGVKKYDLDGKFLQKYNSVKEACFKNNISETKIRHACNGHTKTGGGYIWKYMTY